MALTATSGTLRRLRLFPLDVLLLAYLALTTAVAVSRWSLYPDMIWVLVSNALAALLILLVRMAQARGSSGAWLDAYPLALLIPLYGAIGFLNGSGAAPTHDLTIQAWEQALFGGQPARDWWRAYPSTFWSPILHAAYLGYYLILVVPTVVFAARGDIASLRRSMLFVMATFVPCYLAFIFFPVAGPYYSFPRPAGPVVDNWPARLLYAGLPSGSAFGAAFPSSHVAASVASTAGAWLSSRRLGIVLAIPTVLLVVSVVYCQMHYAIDALAGLAVATVVITVASRHLARRSIQPAP
ncbi:MAG: phosphatase PAP2 family protein [Gemmatimonadota bacterium]